MVYINADIQKLDILRDNKNKSGIYCWENKITGKLYIGSAKNITNRLYDYFNNKYTEFILRKTRSLILESILKYGFGNFHFYILAYCGDNRNELAYWEQYYMDLLNPEYNLRKFAYSPLGYKHSAETILKLKTYIRSPQQLAKMRASKELDGNIIILININNFNIKKYPSLNSAARDLNVSKQILLYYIKKDSIYKNTHLIIKLIKFNF